MIQVPDNAGMGELHDDDPSVMEDTVLAVRVRVCTQARGYDAEDAGRALRTAEYNAGWARHGVSAAPDGPAAETEWDVEGREWQRLLGLVASVSRYDPAGDPVAVAAVEEAARRERAALRAREAADQEARDRRDRALRRADELMDLARAGTLDDRVPSAPEDAAAWRWLRGHPRNTVARVDAWMARAVASRAGAMADPLTRAAALDVLPRRVTAHAALLEALAAAGCPVGQDSAFPGVLAEAATEATVELAAWLTDSPQGRGDGRQRGAAG